VIRGVPRVLGSLLTAASIVACDNGTPPVASPPVVGPDAAVAVDAAPLVDAAPEVSPEAAPPVDGSPEEPRSIALGIELGQQALDSDEGLAIGDAELLALGVRAVVLHASWRDYDVDAADSELRWQRLAERAQLYRQAGAQVLLALDLVQRIETLHPDSVAGWFSSRAKNGVQALVDRAYQSLGDGIGVLCFGHEVDRYLRATLNPARGQFRDLLLYALRYAKQHAARPPEVVIGASFSHVGVLQAYQGDPQAEEVSPLLAESDAVIATYIPLQETYQALPGDEAIDQLAMLQLAAGSRPLLLQEVSYPSAVPAGSSPSRQASFYLRLFDYLSLSDHSIQLVSISPYTDATSDGCRAQAATFPSSNDTLVAVRCSVGLWPLQGPAKPAWSAVLSGLLGFYSP